jgi:tyrosine-protein kinase Etk/Wzc
LNKIQRNNLGVYKIERTVNFVRNYKRPLNIQLLDPKEVANKNLSQLTVALRNKVSSVLELSYSATNVKRGKDVLNALMQVYNETALEDKNKTTQSTLLFIDERLKLISGELTDVEKNVENFKSSQGLTDISSESSLYLSNVQANDAQLNEVNIQLSVIKDIQSYVNSESSEEKLPSTLGISDPVLSDQIRQLGELQLKRDQLLSTTQASNPLLEPINKQIKTTRAGIQAGIKNVYISLISTKQALQKNNSKYETAIKRVPGQERQFISIKRQQSIKESLYLYLLQKKEETALAYAASVADGRVVDDAYASHIPVSPQGNKIYLIAFIIGLALPLAYIYIKDLLDNKINNSNDINKLTKVAILGEIAFEQSTDAIVVNANSRKAIAEQFRSIRTNMQYLSGKQVEGKGRVTLFTSSMSGEGKSFVASNVAAALAISGRRTVLLELDLRKPKISKYLDLTNKTGMSNYLIGKATMNDIIQPTSINVNLYVIGSGPIPPNPSELLIQNDLDILFQYLKANFDEIIIDTPPVGLVTDAQILSRFADVSIYLIRHGVTTKDQVRQFNKLYSENKFPKLNVIFNGVELGGRYGYGYGRGYGYGYYSDASNLNKKDFSGVIKDLVKRF